MADRGGVLRPPTAGLSRRAVLGSGLAAASALGVAGSLASAPAAYADPSGHERRGRPGGRPGPAGPGDHHTQFTRFSGHALRRGSMQGAVLRDEGVRISRPTSTRDHVDPFSSGVPVSYDEASWTSPVVRTPFGLTELIASWNVETPDQTWVEG